MGGLPPHISKSSIRVWKIMKCLKRKLPTFSFFFLFSSVSRIFFCMDFFYFKFYKLEFIYICNKKYFSFPKKFFICNKKFFLRRNFNFFVPKIFKFFLQKNCQKSPKKIFQSVFWPKCEKNF